MQYLGIMAGFDGETQRHLLELRKRLFQAGYGDEEEPVPPHVLLGTCSILNGNSVVELIEKAASESCRFAVSFDHIGFRHGGREMILSLGASQKLFELKCNFGQAYDWAPYYSLLIEDPDITLTASYELVKEFEPFDGIIDRLYLYEFTPAVPLLEAPLEGDLT